MATTEEIEKFAREVIEPVAKKAWDFSNREERGISPYRAERLPLGWRKRDIMCMVVQVKWMLNAHCPPGEELNLLLADLDMLLVKAFALTAKKEEENGSNVGTDNSHGTNGVQAG